MKKDVLNENITKRITLHFSLRFKDICHGALRKVQRTDSTLTGRNIQCLRNNKKKPKNPNPTKKKSAIAVALFRRNGSSFQNDRERHNG